MVFTKDLKVKVCLRTALGVINHGTVGASLDLNTVGADQPNNQTDNWQVEWQGDTDKPRPRPMLDNLLLYSFPTINHINSLVARPEEVAHRKRFLILTTLGQNQEMHPPNDQVTESNSVQDTGPTELVGGGVELDETVEVEDHTEAPDDEGSLEDAEGMIAVVIAAGRWVGVCADRQRESAARDKQEAWEHRVYFCKGGGGIRVMCGLSIIEKESGAVNKQTNKGRRSKQLVVAQSETTDALAFGVIFLIVPIVDVHEKKNAQGSSHLSLLLLLLLFFYGAKVVG